MQRTRTEKAMRNILLCMFFFNNKTMFFQFRTVITTKKRLYVTYILDNSFLLYRISNKFVQGIAGKKKALFLFLLGMWMLQTKSLLRFMVDYRLGLV